MRVYCSINVSGRFQLEIRGVRLNSRGQGQGGEGVKNKPLDGEMPRGLKFLFYLRKPRFFCDSSSIFEVIVF